MSTTAPAHRHARPPHPALGLLVFAAALVVVAVVGGLAATSASSTYEGLEQPAFAPPSWLFGPVWTVLYVMIAVAGWRYWLRAGRVDTALGVYAGQLVLNACWTPLFFGADRYGLAFAEIVLLAVSVVATIALFARRDRLAAGLLVPYLAWVLFAAALNLAVWRLN